VQLSEHDVRLAQTTAELAHVTESVQAAETALAQAGQRYTFHQELRTYLDALGDCWDAKARARCGHACACRGPEVHALTQWGAQMQEVAVLEEAYDAAVATAATTALERRERLLADDAEVLSEELGQTVTPAPGDVVAARHARAAAYHGRHMARRARNALAAQHPKLAHPDAEGDGWYTPRHSGTWA
jgi:hypothetical protein